MEAPRSKSPGGGGKPRGRSAAPAMGQHGTKPMSSKRTQRAGADAAVNNPFEARSNKKVRFDVLGRKLKGAERNVSLARSKSLDRRQTALRGELAAGKKSNAFIDRRFGEQDSSLDSDSKNLVRLQKERLRQLKASKKKSRFQLDDDGGGGGAPRDVLTHFGKALSEVEQDSRGGRGGGGHEDDEDDDGGVFAAGFAAAHFGGGNQGDEDGPSLPSWRGKAPVPAWAADGGAAPAAAPHRTYKEIMEEVIAKSKLGRAERAKEKHEQESTLERLDQQLSVVAGLLRQGGKEVEKSRKRRREGGGGAGDDSAADAIAEAEAMLEKILAAKLAAAAAGGGPAGAAPAAPPAPAAAPRPPPDEYDSLMFTLARESRAAIARDRSKTDTEAAEDESERLRELEALRLGRMHGGAPAVSHGDDGDPKVGQVDASGRAAGSAAAASARFAAASRFGGGDDLGPEITTMLTLRQQRRAQSGASLLDFAAQAAARRAAGGEEEEGEEDDEEEEEDDSSSDDDDDNDEEEEDEEEDGEGEGGPEEDASDEGEEDDDLDLQEPAPAPSATDAAADGRGHRAAKAPAAAPAAPSVSKSASGGRPGPSSSRPKALAPASTAAAEGEVEEMPFTLPCPTTHAGLSELVERYCEPLRTAPSAPSPAPSTPSLAASAALAELLRRIRACHSLLLVGASNKPKLVALYACLLEEVVSCGDAAASIAAAGGDPGAALEWRLQPVFDALFSMAQEGPLAADAGRLWRAAVARIHARVTTALQSSPMGPVLPPHSSGSSSRAPCSPGSPCWLTGGELLLARVAARMFPLTDFRHVVVNSLLLLCGQLLTQVPVCNETDVCRGLLVASAAADLAAPGRKLVPEVVGFVHSVLALFAATPQGGTASSSSAAAPAASLALPRTTPNFGPILTAAAAGGAKGPGGSLLQWALIRGAEGPDAAAPLRTAVPLGLLAAASSVGAPPGAAPSVVSRAGACRVALAACARLCADLAAVWVPSAFVEAAAAAAQGGAGATLARQLADAAIAPNGDAARGLTPSARGPGAPGAGDGLRTVHLAQPVPLASAPEMLDPMLAALATTIALLRQQPLPCGSTSPAAPLALDASLSATVKDLLARRDALAGLRAPLRLRERAAPPASIRTFAPLLEDVNAPRAMKSLPASSRHGKGGPDAAAEAEAEAREELRALQRQKKREARGTVRELRLDRSFIVREADGAAAARDKEREGNYKQLMTFLQQQQATHNLMGKKSPGIGKEGMEGRGSGGATMLNVGKTKADRLARRVQQQPKEGKKKS